MNDWKNIFKFWKNDFDIKVIHIDSNVIYKLKAVSVGERHSRVIIKFKGLNAHFGEIDVDRNNCKGITEDVIYLRKSKLGNYISLYAESRDKQHDSTQSRNPPVPKMFQVRKQNVGKCQIYAAILLIHTVYMLSAQ